METAAYISRLLHKKYQYHSLADNKIYSVVVINTDIQTRRDW